MRRLVLGLALLSSSACHPLAQVPLVVGPAAGPTLRLSPSEAEEAPATLAIAIADRERAIQSLPGTWDTATLRLDHPTRLVAPRLKSLGKGTMTPNGTGGYVATGTFGSGLRPAAGYTLMASLWSGGASGTLKGERRIKASLVAGANAITLPIEVYPALGLSSCLPSSGMAGDTVTLQGQGISVDPSNDTASLGGLSATVGVASSVSLSVTVPNLEPGTYNWQLKVGSSMATLTGFTVGVTLGARQTWSLPASHQTDPALAWGSNRYLVVWDDDRNGGKFDVYGKFVATDGSSPGSDFNLTNAPTATQKQAHVAYNPTLDQFLLVWQVDGTVWAQLVNGGGTLAGDPLSVATGANTQGKPQVVYNPKKKDYMVVWCTNDAKVIGQRLSETNALLDSKLEIADEKKAQGAVVIAYSTVAEKYLVAWQETKGKDEIRARRVTSNGTIEPDNLTIAAQAGKDMIQPAVAVDSDTGNFLVVWVQESSLVLGRLVRPSGALTDSALTISNAVGTKTRPRLSYEPWRQRFLMVWSDNRNATTDVYGQYLNSDSNSVTLLGGNFGVDTYTGNQTPCDVAVSPTAQRGLVALQDSSGNGDIVVREVP